MAVDDLGPRTASPLAAPAKCTSSLALPALGQHREVSGLPNFHLEHPSRDGGEGLVATQPSPAQPSPARAPAPRTASSDSYLCGSAQDLCLDLAGIVGWVHP